MTDKDTIKVGDIVHLKSGGLVEATRLGSFPVDLDKLIAEALGLPLDAEQLDQWCHATKDHWLLGPHAYALYRLTLQRKQCNHSGISGP